MKKHLLLFLVMAALHSVAMHAVSRTPVSQMERLSRGVVAMHNSAGGNYVTWRLLGTDPQDVVFDIYRDGALLKEDQFLTSYSDAAGTASSKYRIVAKSATTGLYDASADVETWADVYKNIKLSRPQGDGYAYYPHDCSVADLNGDGEYEIVVKWNPTNAQDNAFDGYTGNCILDAYTLDGVFMWRVDLGKNIRSGSHYTQFLVYDFDGDGKAELVCKTAPGSVDGKGNYVNKAADDAAILAHDNSIDYRNSAGRIMSGPEYLTVFNGETGAAVHTVWYNPNRAMGVNAVGNYSSNWGDDYGNRGERFLACVAYLDGPDKNPSAVMCRGYYTASYLWAVDFDGRKLSTHWRHASTSKSLAQVTDRNGKVTTKVYTRNTAGVTGSYTAYGQGNHNISVADVDGDGCDEIIYGSATIDNDGFLLYTTGLGHGDALHVSDMMPDREGLEVMTPHEDSPYGFDVHDAATGEIIHHVTGNGDTGRGMAADYTLSSRGFEFWSAASYDLYDNNLKVLGSGENTRPPYAHRVYWNGEARDQQLTGVNIYYAGSNSKSVRLNNINHSASPGGSKGYPCISADILGDWREEIVMFCSTDSASVNILSTTVPTTLRVPTLMHDHVYRMGVAWQNVAYNQPPHLGYYLPDSVGAKNLYDKSLRYQKVVLGDAIHEVEGTMLRATRLSVGRTLLDGKVKSYTGLDDNSGLSFKYNEETGAWSLSGTPVSAGLWQVVLKTTGDPVGINAPDTISVDVTEPTGIISAPANGNAYGTQDGCMYNMAGQKVNANYNGIVIKNRRKYIKN